MPNYNLDEITKADKWVVDAASGAIIGLSSGGAFTQFTSSTQNPWSIVLAGTPAVLTNPVLQFTNSVNNYTQIAIQNKSAGVNASVDLIAYPDNVTSSDLTGFCNVGITSSGFSQAAYAITGSNDAYLFGSAPTGAGKVGNLIIATDSTGSANSIRFATNGFNSTSNFRFQITNTGATVVSGTLGYATGAGGAVTQITSRTTGVTLSKGTGQITMFTAAGSATAASFTVTNTLVAATDIIVCTQTGGTNQYVFATTAAAGSFVVTFFTTGGVASDAPIINFAVIKGVAA